MLSRQIAALALIATALLFPLAERAAAHPHEWIDVASEIVFDDSGRLVAIRHHWRFDEAFSAYASQGLDADGDGALTTEELAPLAKINVESLAEFDFFTDLVAGEDLVGFRKPEDYWLDQADDRLTLHFTLPLAEPLPPGAVATLDVYDPEYYIAFTVPSANAVRLVNAPAECRLNVRPAATPDAATAAMLATVGPDQRELPSSMQGLTAGLDNSSAVDCGGGATAGAGAADATARQLAASGDLRALPAVDAQPEKAAAASPSLGARIAALQSRFYRSLTGALKSMKSEGSAFWWLGAVSFLYGVFHAAGPGHGKVVVSSYLLANEVQVRRGVGIAFLASFAQAVTAVAIVGVMAIVLGATGTAMTRAAGFMESASYALVLALGLYLILRKGRDVARLAAGAPVAACGHAHHHHHHHHHHHPQFGSGRDITPAGEHPGAEPPAPGSALATIVSVGFRPCSGALIVLVFALAQGMLWAGIAATLLMAFGTAITVAALATLAVAAKGFAARLAERKGSSTGEGLLLALELAAAILIAALGGVLLAGSLAA